MKYGFKGLDEFNGIVGKLDVAEMRDVGVGGNPNHEYVGVWNKSRDMLETITEKRRSMLIQHKDAFESLGRAVQKKKLNISGFVNDFGGRVQTYMQFPDLKINLGTEQNQDMVTLGVTIVNDYSNTTTKGEGMGVRAICDNGMFFGKVINTVFRQHSKQEVLEKSLEEFIDKVVNNAKTLKEVLKNSKKEKFPSIEDAREVILGGLKSKKKTKTVLDLFESKDDVTRYVVYNALTNYATHMSNNDKERNKVQNVAQKVLIRPMNKLKREVWEDE